MTSLTAEITAEEVEPAVAQLKRGKFTRPDRLSNVQEFLVGEHASSSQCIERRIKGTVPALFAKATIHCIPKCSKPATGLDYRSVALLNSEYKIFTRILASRLDPIFKQVVDVSQSGFVPGSSIRSTWQFLRSIWLKLAAYPKSH